MIARFLWRLWYAFNPEPAGLSPHDAARYTATKYLRTNVTYEELKAEIDTRVAALGQKLTAKNAAFSTLTDATNAVADAQHNLNLAASAESTAASNYTAADEAHDAEAQSLIDFVETLKAA